MFKLYFSYRFYAGVLILVPVRRKIRENGGKIFKIKEYKPIRIDVLEEKKEDLLNILSEYGVDPQEIIEPVSETN